MMADEIAGRRRQEPGAEQDRSGAGHGQDADSQPIPIRSRGQYDQAGQQSGNGPAGVGRVVDPRHRESEEHVEDHDCDNPIAEWLQLGGWDRITGMQQEAEQGADEAERWPPTPRH